MCPACTPLPCQDAEPLATEWVLPLLEGQGLVPPHGTPDSLTPDKPERSLHGGTAGVVTVVAGVIVTRRSAVGDDEGKMMGEDVSDSGRGRVGMTGQWWAWLCGGGRSWAAP